MQAEHNKPKHMLKQGNTKKVLVCQEWSVPGKEYTGVEDTAKVTCKKCIKLLVKAGKITLPPMDVRQAILEIHKSLTVLAKRPDAPTLDDMTAALLQAGVHYGRKIMPKESLESMVGLFFDHLPKEPAPLTIPQ